MARIIFQEIKPGATTLSRSKVIMPAHLRVAAPHDFNHKRRPLRLGSRNPPSLGPSVDEAIWQIGSSAGAAGGRCPRFHQGARETLLAPPPTTTSPGAMHSAICTAVGHTTLHPQSPAPSSCCTLQFTLQRRPGHRTMRRAAAQHAVEATQRYRGALYNMHTSNLCISGYMHRSYCTVGGRNMNVQCYLVHGCERRL